MRIDNSIVAAYATGAQVNNQSIPANDDLKALMFQSLVAITAGGGGGIAYTEDGIWNMLRGLSILDRFGEPVFQSTANGLQLRDACYLGGVRLPTTTQTATGAGLTLNSFLEGVLPLDLPKSRLPLTISYVNDTLANIGGANCAAIVGAQNIIPIFGRVPVGAAKKYVCKSHAVVAGANTLPSTAFKEERNRSMGGVFWREAGPLVTAILLQHKGGNVFNMTNSLWNAGMERYLSDKAQLAATMWPLWLDPAIVADDSTTATLTITAGGANLLRQVAVYMS